MDLHKPSEEIKKFEQGFSYKRSEYLSKLRTNLRTLSDNELEDLILSYDDESRDSDEFMPISIEWIRRRIVEGYR